MFIDETGFMLEPLVRRTWAPRGKTPVVRVTSPHERISAIGAMTLRRVPIRFGFEFYLLRDNLNFKGYSVASFLTYLRRTLRGEITIVWDQINIHKAARVKEFISQHTDVEVFEFPPYAPELNPVDYVWSYVKYSRLANYCPQNLLELRETITAELTAVKMNPRLLRSLFSRTGLGLDGLG
ncbi:MAG: IS630 family transposase [Sedimentisphaerales bacterium]|nr:IS630 family transposase [Sedimentisphaerales bacterium]